MTQAEEFSLDAGGIRMSGIAYEPKSAPVGVLLCLHGGGMRAAYFDAPGHRELSLLRLAAAEGFRALALDRPGYGASVADLPDGIPLRRQADMTRDALAATGVPGALPLVVVGHSFGMKLALQLAATDDRRQIVGVACSGAGVRYNPGLASYPGRPDGGVSLSADDRLELFWGPHRLYPPDSLDRERRPTAPVPVTEVAESAEWPALFATMAPSVSVPVLYTIADHERWWDVGPDALAEFRELLTSSPVVEIEWQADAGHNISLGWTARAYHRRVVAFAAACCRLARA